MTDHLGSVLVGSLIGGLIGAWLRFAFDWPPLPRWLKPSSWHWYTIRATVTRHGLTGMEQTDVIATNLTRATKTGLKELRKESEYVRLEEAYPRERAGR